MAWSFVVTDISGAALGELRDLRSVRVRLPLNRVPTLIFTTDVDNPMVPHLVKGPLTLVKAYDNSTGTKVLRFYGFVTGHEKERVGDGGSIGFTCAGPAWRLGRLYIGRNIKGATFGTTPLSLLDRGEMIARIIDALNQGEQTNIFTLLPLPLPLTSPYGSNTGIRRGTITASVSTYVGPWRYKKADEAVNELSAALDGPDWEVVPQEPTSDNYGPIYGLLNVKPIIGTPKLNAAWEFGTGRHNVGRWRDVSDANGLCNDPVILPPGYPDSADRVALPAVTLTAAPYYPTSTDVIAVDLPTLDMRVALAEEHARIRQHPRRTIHFTPTAQDVESPTRVPRLFVDYIVGDVVPFHAVELYKQRDAAGTITGHTRTVSVDALFRVYAVDVSVDEHGVMTPELTLVAEPA